MQHIIKVPKSYPLQIVWKQLLKLPIEDTGKLQYVEDRIGGENNENYLKLLVSTFLSFMHSYNDVDAAISYFWHFIYQTIIFNWILEYVTGALRCHHHISMFSILLYFCHSIQFNQKITDIFEVFHKLTHIDLITNSFSYHHIFLLSPWGECRRDVFITTINSDIDVDRSITSFLSRPPHPRDILSQTEMDLNLLPLSCSTKFDSYIGIIGLQDRWRGGQIFELERFYSHHGKNSLKSARWVDCGANLSKRQNI